MTETPGWSGLVLQGGTVAERWAAVFRVMGEMCAPGTSALALEQWLTAGDRMVSDAAWEMWEEYAAEAPSAREGLLRWWEAAGRSGTGRAVLLLDALSVRELQLILGAAAKRGVPLRGVEVAGARVPTDTETFAKAMGVAQRSHLKGGKPPAGFLLASPTLHADVTDGFEFGRLAAGVPPNPDICLWHPWLDDLLHARADKDKGPEQVRKVAEDILGGDGFWRLVDALRQGRELLITSDHGYAVSRGFVELPSPLGERLRSVFGGQRSGKVPAGAIRLPGGPPLCVLVGDRAAAVGPWKWKVQGGFPYLSHGGLTLGEVSVPMVRVPAL